MKHTIKLAFFVLVIVLQSCSSDTKPVQGAWSITFFNFKGSDRTQDFAGYTFDFEKPKTIVSMYKQQTQVGIFREMPDSARKMCALVFNGNDPKLARLNDEWDMIQKNDNEIDLKRVKNNGTEEVHFTKGAGPTDKPMN